MQSLPYTAKTAYRDAMKYQDFSFTVEDMSDAQAENLFDLITSVVDHYGLTIGGGYRPTTDADYPPFLGLLERLTFWLTAAWKRLVQRG